METTSVRVVLGDVRHERITLPELGELGGHRCHATAVTAAVADHHDVLEAVRLVAHHDVAEERCVGFFRQADRARARHVAARRIEPALRHERHDRRAQRVPELAGNRIAVGAQHVVVFAERQIGAVRLHAARADDDGRLARLQRVADVHPRHLFQPDRIDLRQRIRRVRTVEGVAARRLGGHWIGGGARAAAHARRTGLPSASAWLRLRGARLLRRRDGLLLGLLRLGSRAGRDLTGGHHRDRGTKENEGLLHCGLLLPMGTDPHWIVRAGLLYNSTAARRHQRARVAANTITAPIVIPNVPLDTAPGATL